MKTKKSKLKVIIDISDGEVADLPKGLANFPLCRCGEQAVVYTTNGNFCRSCDEKCSKYSRTF